MQELLEKRKSKLFSSLVLVVFSMKTDRCDPCLVQKDFMMSLAGYCTLEE